MTTSVFPDLSPELIRVMKGALSTAPPEHELSSALRAHEGVRRWWQGLHTALSRGLEAKEVRALASVQISLCGVDALLLQVALDNAGDAPHPDDLDQAKAALAEAMVIEAKARELLKFANGPAGAPLDEELASGMAAYERGETENLRDAVARRRAGHSS
jgi:hypothetical protein